MTSSKGRRLVAVMFTDVVGYTAMMRKDEEVARNARRRHREALEWIVPEAGGEGFAAVLITTLIFLAGIPLILLG